MKGTQYILGLEQIDHLISRSLHLQPYVIFLSDGRPATEKHTVELLAAICEKYKDHWNKSGLKFTAIGFGNEDFSVLRQLCGIIILLYTIIYYIYNYILLYYYIIYI